MCRTDYWPVNDIGSEIATIFEKTNHILDNIRCAVNTDCTSSGIRGTKESQGKTGTEFLDPTFYKLKSSIPVEVLFIFKLVFLKRNVER